MTNEEVIQKVKEEVRLRGLSADTEAEYLKSIRVLLSYYDNRPLCEMAEPEIREFLLYLLEIGRSSGTVNIYNSAFRFVFGAVLEKNLNYQMIPRRRIHRELPTIMSKAEIVKFFSVIDDLRDRAIFETVYGAGLRISEIAHLRVQDIDSEGMRLFVFQGKGGKDRYTLLSQRNLKVLREYWKVYRPNHPDGYLFYTRCGKTHCITIRAIQDAFHKYRKRAEFSDKFTVHTLRHCFATHLLESGIDVCRIKQLMGHTHIQSTTFYLHLLNFDGTIVSPLDTLPKKRGRKPKVKTNA
ncbi:MAG TPA: tyrosine-type recombinase/integrase [Anaerovoracaceae bacterium]|nr:tyrosine-type recombinase/integrase [Anaerovoracaceae bacterium]